MFWVISNFNFQYAANLKTLSISQPSLDHACADRVIRTLARNGQLDQMSDVSVGTMYGLRADSLINFVSDAQFLRLFVHVTLWGKLQIDTITDLINVCWHKKNDLVLCCKTGFVQSAHNLKILNIVAASYELQALVESAIGTKNVVFTVISS